VFFSYPTRLDVPIFRHFNLTIKSGQTVALVGESGSGKSTIVQLLQRFYDPKKGVITIGGIDIASMNVQYLRQQMGFVQQEPVLFSNSIRENILLGRPTATQAEVVIAAQQANIHDFIISLPEGYDTLCGSKGKSLSGGQKQRVSIARAIIRDPKILLLDEATSALDSESEKIVQAALDRMIAVHKESTEDQHKTAATTIVIAHRLSTIQNADTIVVMDRGTIAEMGNHSQLMRKNGIYTRLCQMQK